MEDDERNVPLTRKETEQAVKGDTTTFLLKSMVQPEKCFFCGSTQTYELLLVNNELKILFYHRPIGGVPKALCRKHHFRTVQLDNILTNILRVLFKIW